MTHRFVSAALVELRESMLEYESKEQGLGARFVRQVEETVDRIIANPEAWRRLSPRTRRCLVHAFPFGVFYQIRREKILIVAVMNLRRDPVAWRKRL
jgi:plasmid stabilization system protein ParE